MPFFSRLDGATQGRDFLCRRPENIHQDGCWDAAVYPEFVPLGAVALTLSSLSILTTLSLTYFYIIHHKPLYYC